MNSRSQQLSAKPSNGRIKRAVMSRPGHIEIGEADAPEPGPHQVLLRIQRIGVCGSDVHVFHGKHPYTNYPVVQGHEFSATVAAVGEGVENVELGARVTALPQITCGRCVPCQRGDEHICEELRVQGFQAPGCAQELWVTDADKLVALPAGFSFEQGALVEPISVAVHAVRRAGDVRGRRALVLGAGPIGNFVGQAAQAAGADVLITDRSDYRLSVAQRCGLANTCNPDRRDLKTAVHRTFDGRGFDLAFECVGVEATLTAATENLAKGGTLVVVGVFAEKPRMDLGLVQDRELNVVGTLMYQRPDYEQAVRWIEERKIATEPLVSKHFSLDQYLQAYRFIDQERERTMKVFIDVT